MGRQFGRQKVFGNILRSYVACSAYCLITRLRYYTGICTYARVVVIRIHRTHRPDITVLCVPRTDLRLAVDRCVLTPGVYATARAWLYAAKPRSEMNQVTDQRMDAEVARLISDEVPDPMTESVRGRNGSSHVRSSSICAGNVTPGEIQRIRERLLRTQRTPRPSTIWSFTRRQKLALLSLSLVDFVSFCSMSIMAPFFPKEVNDISAQIHRPANMVTILFVFAGGRQGHVGVDIRVGLQLLRDGHVPLRSDIRNCSKYSVPCETLTNPSVV